MTTQFRVKQTRSVIGHPQKIRRVLKGLGLGRIGRSATVANTPSYRGMIKKVMHMITIEEVKG